MNDEATKLEEQPSVHTEPLNKSSNKKFIYAFLVLFIIIALGSLGYFMVKGYSKPDQAETTEFVSGFPLNQVSMHLINDQDLGKYPLVQFTVAYANVNLNIFEGLTVYRGTNLEPGLAESWTNPDPLTWRFILRKGVKFHSGDPFTAEDIKFTIEQAKTSEKASIPWVSQPMAARVESVKIIDDYTIELKTREPDATLLRWLVWMGIVSKKQVTLNGIEKAVGTGPYKLITLAKREAILQANDDYWDGVPKVKKLIYKVVPSPEKAKEALEKGQLDIITINSGESKIINTQGFQSANFRTGGINWMFLDVNSAKSKYVTGTEKNPFKDVRVRKAITLALDVNKLSSEAGLNAEPVTQFATQELIGFNPQLKRLKTDLDEAKSLLNEAGFPDGFSFTLISDQQVEHIKAVEEIKKQLAEIGITVVLSQPEIDKFYEQLFSGDFSAAYVSYYPDTIDSLDLIDIIFHGKIGSHGSLNVTNYSNSELDSVLDQARSTFDEGKRIELTRQAHALIMQDYPSIPLFTDIYHIYSRDNISYKPSITVMLLGFDMSGRQRVTK